MRFIFLQKTSESIRSKYWSLILLLDNNQYKPRKKNTEHTPKTNQTLNLYSFTKVGDNNRVNLMLKTVSVAAKRSSNSGNLYV